MCASLADATWTEVQRAAASVLLVVPIGSTEQHGPHLPLATDTDIAVALARALAAARPSVVVAPELAYGSSGEHSDFPGTLSIGREALELVLVELGRSASVTFGRTLFLSAHGGNARPVARAVQRLRDEGRTVLAWSPPWAGDAHAGHLETSVMLALSPARVALDRAAAGNVATLSELWEALRHSGVRRLSENGVLGDPTRANAPDGRRLVRQATEDLILRVDAWVR